MHPEPKYTQPPMPPIKRTKFKLNSDELIEMLPTEAKVTQDEANAIIMAARAHWFAEDGETPAAAEEE